jgi:hypothetical protein
MAGGEPKATKIAAKPKPSNVNDALRLMKLSFWRKLFAPKVLRDWPVSAVVGSTSRLALNLLIEP